MSSSSLYLDLVRRLGWKGAVQHIYMFRSVKQGTLIGTDKLGNKYYENRSLPWGQHRWFEPPVPEHPNLQEASAISPEWHGWMHYTHDTPPKNRTVATTTGRQVAEHSDAPIKSHVVPNELRLDWRPNPTLKRDRGYNAPVYQADFQGQNAFWTQPGNPLSPVFKEWSNTSEEDHKLVEEQYPAIKSKSSSAGGDNVPLKPRRLVLPLSKWQKFQKQRDELNAKEASKIPAFPQSIAEIHSKTTTTTTTSTSTVSRT